LGFDRLIRHALCKVRPNHARRNDGDAQAGASLLAQTLGDGANGELPGLLRLEPYSVGLRERTWWGSSSTATSKWAAKLGMNLQSSTLKDDETGEPLHVQQRKQIEAYREAWNDAGHRREPRVSVTRSIFALVDDRDRAYFGREDRDQIGYIDASTRAIFGRSYPAEPDVLVKELAGDEAITMADTLLLTIPNQLGVDYNAHVLESILKVRRSGTRLALTANPVDATLRMDRPSRLERDFAC
jgi:alkanesulfonate monooxygenase SsuD/methylene tetrahydromethanopterin reductase-like flavin-dependent oxidoreductase (luciferase family)